MSNQHSKCDDCYKTHLPENHDRTILPSDAFSEGYVPEFNQASEDEPTKSKVDWSTPYDEWLISILNRFRYGGAIECRAIPSEIQLNIESLIRTEKLKLLAEVRERVGEGYPYCLNNPGCAGTHCNKCWVCRYRNNDEYVQGYESAQDEIAKTLTKLEAEL